MKQNSTTFEFCLSLIKFLWFINIIKSNELYESEKHWDYVNEINTFLYQSIYDLFDYQKIKNYCRKKIIQNQKKEISIAPKINHGICIVGWPLSRRLLSFVLRK